MEQGGSRRAGRSGVTMSRRSSTVVAALLVLTSCGTGGLPAASPTPGPGADTGSPTAGLSGSPSPGATASPGGTLTPDASQSGTVPLPTGTESPLGTGSPSPGSTVAPVTCPTVNPLRVEKVTSEPRRTTEVVTVVSDGKNLTSGTREQTEFLSPTLESPDGSTVTDEAATKKIATLITASGKNRVLLVRPEGPDANASTSRRPFNAPGTYVLFSASAVLNANVVVECGGQEQRWTFTAEADPTTGQVNCAVEPPKTNAIARLVYTNNC